MRIVNDESEELRRWLEEFERRRDGSNDAAREIARAIVDDVWLRGDAAAAEAVARIDGLIVAPDELLISSARTSGQAPLSSHVISSELEAAIAIAMSRIERFHRDQKPRSYSIEDGDSTLQHEVRPLQRVGIYVPGGSATYISSLLMCAIPAQIAGVRELVVATTMRAAASPELKYVCTLLGIREIYRAGGAAAIAALAFGTESLRRVDKIVGPGNAYVAAAKELVRGGVGVDLDAGPSEIVVVADASADAQLVAADLLAQAEHGRDSSVLCITTSSVFAERLRAEVARQLPEPAGAAGAVVANGAILLVRDLTAACELVDRLAPEHLELMIDDPTAAIDQIENCAAIFVGSSSGVALGDYAVGTNHVLPTGGSARFASPLGVYDFVKRRSIVRLGDATGATLGAAAAVLATAEGLPLHARSCELRTAVAVRSAR